MHHTVCDYKPYSKSNVHLKAERGRPRQIKWLTFIASGHGSQTEMSWKSKGTSALIKYSIHQSEEFNSLTQVTEAPICETQGIFFLLHNNQNEFKC